MPENGLRFDSVLRCSSSFKGAGSVVPLKQRWQRATQQLRRVPIIQWIAAFLVPNSPLKTIYGARRRSCPLYTTAEVVAENRILIERKNVPENDSLQLCKMTSQLALFCSSITAWRSQFLRIPLLHFHVNALIICRFEIPFLSVFQRRPTFVLSRNS